MEVGPDQRWRPSARGLAWGLEVEEAVSYASGSERLKADSAEGILELLSALIAGGGGSAEELSLSWGASLRRKGVRRAPEWLLDATAGRLTHLQERGLVERAGRRWAVTELGLSWLRRAGRAAPTRDEGALEQLWALLHAQRQRARESMRALLLQMDPLAFEALICDLLERMGYRDVTLTERTHDMGVDIVATIELGITAVREVIQVKRHQRNIQRPVLDALRGSLHRAHAVRGTLITTADFSKGTQEAAFELGAAPITLIHGERLVDLLMEHELGARKAQVTLWRVDPRVFEARPSSLSRRRAPLSEL
jgi:restriction system protein